ncbi:hypothetical protein MMC16_001609 [Acarospora aff. strigata]|nr:hypothetical protein [Acarospora aff. strigata]
MSALTSPTSIDGHHRRLAGFKEQSLDDPFLPASPHEEQLLQLSNRIAATALLEAQATHHFQYDFAGHAVQIASNTSQPQITSHSDSTLCPLRKAAIHDRSIGRGNTATSHTSSHGHSEHHSAALSPTTTSDFFSPKAVYPTHAGHSELSDIATPSLEEDYLFEADFGFMPSISPEENLQYSVESHGFYSDPSSVSEAQQSYVGPKERPLLGTADKSLSLLSPVLTSSPSPPLRIEQYRHLDMGPASIGGGAINSPSKVDPAATFARMEIPVADSRHTPALTGSPSDIGPEIERATHIGRTASPIVRVESYSRGDSPARTGHLGRSSSKRSRVSMSSAHLSPYGEADSSEDESEATQRHHNFRYAAVAGSTSQNDANSSFLQAPIGREGVNPDMRSQLDEIIVPNLAEQEEHRHIVEKNADVEDWLAHSESGSHASWRQSSPARSRTSKPVNERRRAKSMGDKSAPRGNEPELDTAAASFNYRDVPGPGLLLDEESGEEEDDSGDTGDEMPESPSAVIDQYGGGEESPHHVFPTANEGYLANQSYRSRPWEDPPYDLIADGMAAQPTTSNAAIMRFKQRADNLETASRVATWGTRRMSETDIDKIVGDGGLFKRLSFGKEKDKSKAKGERRGSFLEQAATRLLPKRSNSHLRRKTVPQPQQTSSSEIPEASRKESVGSVGPSKLGKKPKSPMLNTGGAVAAMAGQIAAIGGSGSVSATAAAATPHGPWMQAKSVIKRTRSRSELGDVKPSAAANPGLADLMNQHGGPPMPTLASPPQEPLNAKPFGPPDDEEIEDEEEEEEGEGRDKLLNDMGIIMNLTLQGDDITPTLEGFKSNVRQLNPRLAPFLIDRIGHEQVRRYKKLVESKIQHLNAVSNRNCMSGKYCFALGGEASFLPSKPIAKDPEGSYAGFQATGTVTSDNESTAFGEGTVTAAQFPPGVPLPPVTRLPTEFECPLCFKVKKFQKPSDWTKHVHEDVQPFTCTFPNCAEPKSFKRKADWVRHENERHRQLEWWTCNMLDCSHTCYRKDNFVQHLVREHKRPEPKVKASKASIKASGRARAGRTQVEVIEDWKATVPGSLESTQDEVDKVWALVEECRHDTPKQPREEACKFCGNVCNSWKKLTVHLAKHMEQISMPVLRLVEKEAVTLDTVISPIEQRNPHQGQSFSPIGSVRMPKFEPLGASPLGVPAHVLPPPGNPLEVDNPGAYSNSTGAQATNRYMAVGAESYDLPRPLSTTMPNYSDAENTAFLMPSYQTYQDHPQRHFVPVAGAQGFSGQPPAHNYGAISGHLARPRMDYSSALERPLPLYDPQPTFTSPMENNPFLYPNPEGAEPMPSLATTASMQYSPASAVPFSQAPSGSASQYLPGSHNYPYQQP